MSGGAVASSRLIVFAVRTAVDGGGSGGAPTAALGLSSFPILQVGVGVPHGDVGGSCNARGGMIATEGDGQQPRGERGHDRRAGERDLPLDRSTSPKKFDVLSDKDIINENLMGLNGAH